MIRLLDDSHPVVILGGAGFIGTNLAKRFLHARQPVLLIDNLSRPGTDRNVDWLRQHYGSLVDFQLGDVTDPASIQEAIAHASSVFHLAAQVAVTASHEDPEADFDVNARGSLNVLEALRACGRPIPFFYASTSKVYGPLADIALTRVGKRYEPRDAKIWSNGISEARALDFHTPFACSKGTAEQYVLTYARAFGVRAVVFRLSTVYGPRQFGTEDHGWLAHFLDRALQDESVTIYGDGMQVRDVLFVSDLMDALLLTLRHFDDCVGQAFNVGGGPSNAVSLLEVVDMIGNACGRRPEVRFEPARAGDQSYYVTDNRKLTAATGFIPRILAREGVRRLTAWLIDQKAKPSTSALEVGQAV